MKTTEWLKHYQIICEKLQIDPVKDLQAAVRLSNLINGRCIFRRDLQNIFLNKRFVAVFGAGPSLEDDLNDFLDVFDLEDVAAVAADGAVNAFISRGIRPDVVVTDLDGGDEALLKTSDLKAVFVVHAHGDNVEKINQLVPKLATKILGTTQTEPVGVLDNFGGFTDGDRAVYMVEEIGVKTIVVAGMDFDGEIGKFSKPYDLNKIVTKRKKLKLQIGKTLLEILASNTDAALYDASQNNSTIKGFHKTNWKELKERLCRLK